MIERVVTHHKPHLDEIVALWLLRKFGEDRFPGIVTARVETVSGGVKLEFGKTEQELEAEGTVCLGIGSGFRFNHHPHTEFGEDCTATLAAKFLGVDDDPALEQVLSYTLENDLRGRGTLLDLAHIIGLLNQENPDNPERVVEWVIPVLEAKYEEQKRFFTVVKDEFERTAKIFNVPFGKAPITVVSVRSDLAEMAKFAHSRHGARAQVVILQSSSGQVQILTRGFPKVRIADVVQTILLEEQKAKGEVRTTDWATLGGDGAVEGAEEWYYLLEGEMLLNGSRTAPDVPPTRLSLERIEELVTQCLNLSYFAEGCPPVGCAGPKCPVYQYGWQRCRKRRFEAQNPGR